MDEEKSKRALDGPLGTSVRSDPPDAQSIDALRERYMLHRKLTSKKPATPFDKVLSDVRREEHEGRSDRGGQTSDEELDNAPEADDAAAGSESAQQPEGSSAPTALAAPEPAEMDTFQRVDKKTSLRLAPLPSGRHPETPLPGACGKVIIKV